MLRKAAEQGQRATPNGNVNPATAKVSNDATPSPVTLAEIGITRDQSSRYQKLAAMPDEHFETGGALNLQSMLMVPGTGLEPVRLAPADFKSAMFTNFITRARMLEAANCTSADTRDSLKRFRERV